MLTFLLVCCVILGISSVATLYLLIDLGADVGEIHKSLAQLKQSHGHLHDRVQKSMHPHGPVK